MGGEAFPTAEEVSQGANLTGKTAIVTGGSAGIGKETARVLALRGCHVILACRSIQKGEEAKAEILRSIQGAPSPGAVEVEQLELGSLASVRNFADRFGKRKSRDLHLLINNAGVFHLDGSKSEDGFEVHFGVNHLGHFLLTLLLIPHLRASAPARVIIVASDAYLFAGRKVDPTDYNLTKEEEEHLGPNRAYGISKLYNILFAKELARRLQGSGITVNSLHPGIIRTDLAIPKGVDPADAEAAFQQVVEMAKEQELSVAQGAATTVFLAVSEEGRTRTGEYFHGTQPHRASNRLNNQNLINTLWEVSEKLAKVTTSRL